MRIKPDASVEHIRAHDKAHVGILESGQFCLLIPYTSAVRLEEIMEERGWSRSRVLSVKRAVEEDLEKDVEEHCRDCFQKALPVLGTFTTTICVHVVGGPRGLFDGMRPLLRPRNDGEMTLVVGRDIAKGLATSYLAIWFKHASDDPSFAMKSTMFTNIYEHAWHMKVAVYSDSLQSDLTEFLNCEYRFFKWNYIHKHPVPFRCEKCNNFHIPKVSLHWTKKKL